MEYSRYLYNLFNLYVNEYVNKNDYDKYKKTLELAEFQEIMYDFKLYPIEREPRIFQKEGIYIYIDSIKDKKYDYITIAYLTDRPLESFVRINQRVYKLKASDVEKIEKLLLIEE